MRAREVRVRRMRGKHDKGRGKQITESEYENFCRMQDKTIDSRNKEKAYSGTEEEKSEMGKAKRPLKRTLEKEEEERKGGKLQVIEGKRETRSSDWSEEKYIIVKGKWGKYNDFSEKGLTEVDKKRARFGANHRGEAIVSARLKDELCSKNKGANLMRIMAIIYKERFAVEKIEAKGFNTADIRFVNAREANRCLDRYEVMREEDKKIHVKIMEKNVRAKGVIRDWDNDMPLN